MIEWVLIVSFFHNAHGETRSLGETYPTEHACTVAARGLWEETLEKHGIDLSWDCYARFLEAQGDSND